MNELTQHFISIFDKPPEGQIRSPLRICPLGYRKKSEENKRVEKMLYQSVFIENEIRNAIMEKFPLLAHNIYHDDSRDEYVVAVYDKDTYYSEAYRELVMELKINSLWSAGINNVYSVVEDNPKYSMELAAISV